MDEAGGLKAQSTIEFLSIYSWTLISVILLAVVVSVFATSQSKNVYPPSHCYITPNLQCGALPVMSNSIGSVAAVAFVNDLGAAVSFPNNAFEITPQYTSGNEAYYGQCAPSTASNGKVVVCNASLGSLSLSLGTHMEPTFIISYRICNGASCSSNLPVYNTSGNAEVVVSPYVSDWRTLLGG